VLSLSDVVLDQFLDGVACKLLRFALAPRFCACLLLLHLRVGTALAFEL